MGGGSSRGLALIVVLCVLGVLAILGTAFATLSRLERKASQQRIHATRALLLARSGIEDAMARLSAGQDASRTDTRYCGEDFDANGVMNAGLETAEQRFNPSALDTDACPLDQALRPSFFVHDRTGAGALPALTSLNGRWRGYSGRLGQPSQGASYALKVEDESAKINVNGGFLDARDRDNDGIPDHHDGNVRATPIAGLPAGSASIGRGWNCQLGRILGILGNQPELNLPTLGTDVLARRPPGGYRSIAEVQLVLGTSNDLSPYLTVSSWVDRKVVHPNAYERQLVPAYPPPPSPRFEILPPPEEMCAIVKGRLPLAPEEEGRPPVNLNAAGRPVLMALVQGLRGTSFYTPSLPVTYEIFETRAPAVVDALLARRGERPFESWGDFSAFCDSLVPAALNGMNQTVGATADAPYSGQGHDKRGGGNLCGADLLKSNFDPNTHLLKIAPDQLMFRWIDKSDLLAWSTEGSLYPTGRFTLTAVGCVFGADGHLLAQRTLRAQTEAFALLRQTSQKDFLAGRRPDAGPTSCLSWNTDPLNPTSGASASWNTADPGTGLAAMTYPCPMTVPPENAADFEGYIGLATVEAPSSPPPGGTLTLLHHFDDGWDADTPGGLPAPRTACQTSPLINPSGGKLQTDLAVSVWPAPFVEPNTLCPDGFFAQNEHCPAFLSGGNLPAFPEGNRACISYWVKTMSVKGVASSLMHISCLRWTRGMPFQRNPYEPHEADGQALFIGQYGDFHGAVLEKIAKYLDVGEADIDNEISAAMTYSGNGLLGLCPDLRWRLATLLFDTSESTPGRDLSISFRGARPGGHAWTGGGISPPVSPYPPFPAGSPRENLVGSGNVPIVLGGQRSTTPAGRGHTLNSKQVMDELAICDFGPNDLDQATVLSQQWASRRYADGRYYKQDDACFLSAPLALPGSPGIRLQRVWWTAYLPGESRQEHVPSPNLPLNFRIPASGTPRDLDPILNRSRISLELTNRDGGRSCPLTQGGIILEQLQDSRYRVRFLPDPVDPVTKLSDLLNQPVLETPFFDDITFACQGASGPRILSWGSP